MKRRILPSKQEREAHQAQKKSNRKARKSPQALHASTRGLREFLEYEQENIDMITDEEVRRITQGGATLRAEW